MSEEIKYYALPEATLLEVLNFIGKDPSVELFNKVNKAVLVVSNEPKKDQSQAV